MAYASEEAYEEMIQALGKYPSDLGEQCETMSAAAQDCVDNTDGDPAAAASASNLQSCVAKIQANFETIQGIMTALQEELEEIREAAARAQQSSY